MPYIAINQTNAFDPNNHMAFATEAQAKAKAQEILQQNPAAVVVTAQLLETYTATVTVTAAAVPDVPESADPETIGAD